MVLCSLVFCAVGVSHTCAFLRASMKRAALVILVESAQSVIERPCKEPLLRTQLVHFLEDVFSLAETLLEDLGSYLVCLLRSLAKCFAETNNFLEALWRRHPCADSFVSPSTDQCGQAVNAILPAHATPASANAAASEPAFLHFEMFVTPTTRLEAEIASCAMLRLGFAPEISSEHRARASTSCLKISQAFIRLRHSHVLLS